MAFKTPKPSPYNREFVKKFLTTLSGSLDLMDATREMGISPEEGESILEFILQNKEAVAGVAGGAKPESRPLSGNDGEFVIHVDGASRGNPGDAGAGAIIKGPDGEVIGELTRYLGKVTNNVAEYEALILALEEAVSLGCRSISVYADSELMVKQINGVYRVKNEGLKGLYAIAMKLVEQFATFRITHVKREFNGEADKLANEAIDNRGKE
ncbi:MAG: ribonuclease HI family protein [Thermodesulfobacteriota bacterium]